MQDVRIPLGNSYMYGDLMLVPNTKSIIIFAHGSGSSRFSVRNKFVAHYFNTYGLSTLLFDLLTPEEDKIDHVTHQFRFDIPLLAQRLALVTQWVKKNYVTTRKRPSHKLKLGYFGASTGAAAALIAAAELPDDIEAVVSRGGRPDLAGDTLTAVKAPTLLIVGALDPTVITLNEQAYNQLTCSSKELSIIPGAGHLFEEPETLEKVANLSMLWFERFLEYQY